MREARKKLFPNRNHFVRLSACSGYSPRHDDVLRFTIRSTKGVARQRSARQLLPRHDDPRIESSSEGYPDPLRTFEVSWEITGENLTELLVIHLRIQQGLVLPRLGLEVRSLPL